jgi:hypothetical protein
LVEPEFLRLSHEIWDSPWLRAFWWNSFEGEVVHEVTQASPKFRCNLLGDSGDRVMQSCGLTRDSCFSRSVWGGQSNFVGRRVGLIAPGSSGESFDFGWDLLVACCLDYRILWLES